MKRLSLIILAFTLFLLLPFSPKVYAQLSSYGIHPSISLQHCAVDQWTGDNGLLSNNLTSVIQSKTGFLWITTNNGLMRFDGNRLEIFDREIIPFLATDAFYRVYEDSEGVLWFATRGNGIIRYEGKKFEQYLPDNKLVPKSVRTLLLHSDGSIWAGTDNKGIIQMRDTSVRRITHPMLENVIIMSLAEGKDNSIYIATNTKGLLKYKDGVIWQISAQEGLESNSVNVVRCLPDGRIIAGTTNGMHIIDDNSVKTVDFLKNIQVNYFLVDQYESIWIGTERGLARINEKYGVSEFLKSGKGFAGAHITSLFFDNEGSLWMSTGKSGLLRMKESLIRSYTDQHGLSLNRVNIITEAPGGKFYVGLDDGFVNIIEKGEIRPLPINQKSWNESIRDILVEEDGTCWIASYNGVLKKNGNNERLFTTFDGLSSSSVRRIFRDSKNNLWFATRSGGVIKFNNDKVSRIYNRETGLSSDYILSIEEDQHGRLLIGTHSGGLNIIHPDGSIKTLHLKEDDDGVLIFNTDIDSHGNVWLATSVGLYHFNFDTEKFTRLVIENVIKGESYFDWVEDNVGNVWITTNIGVVQLLKTDVIKFIKGEAASIKSKVLNEYDGMKNKECTGATRSTKSTKGQIWIPTIEGICVIDPVSKQVNEIIPQVYITEVKTDEKTIISPGEKIVVEPGSFRISITFTSLSLWAPGKIKFKYKLSSIDDNWVETKGDKRTVDYTNLSPGNYTFQVIASNNDGVWNETGATISLKVLPFFYQTVGFYIIIAVLLLVTFYGIYKWRVNAVEKKNRELLKVNSELDRFVYSASHDLRAPLASVLGLVKLARLDDPDKTAQYFDMIERSIHKLDGFIHDIINFSRNARTELQVALVPFEQMINEIFEGLKHQEKSLQIRKTVEINGSGAFYTDAKRLQIVLVNLITNAIKYHNVFQGDPYIAIRITYNSTKAVIQVEDNGIGIDAKHVDNIFKMFYRASDRSNGSGLGLYIAKETVDKLKGTLRVESEYNAGSTFIVEIPSLLHVKEAVQSVA